MSSPLGPPAGPPPQQGGPVLFGGPAMAMGPPQQQQQMGPYNGQDYGHGYGYGPPPAQQYVQGYGAPNPGAAQNQHLMDPQGNPIAADHHCTDADHRVRDSIRIAIGIVVGIVLCKLDLIDRGIAFLFGG